MKKRAIDGLPGLTMQGTKGTTGKRGYTTFYSNNESYSLYVISDDGTPVFGTKTIGFYAAENSDYLNSYMCFSAQSFTPIEHDRLLNKEEDSLMLYEVSSFVTVNITITEVEDFVYEMSLSPEELADVQLDSKSLAYIVKAINNMLSKYKNLDYEFVEKYQKELSTYTFCILYKLDSLTYTHGGSNNKSIEKLSITASTSDIDYYVWAANELDTAYDSSSFYDEQTFNIIANRQSFDEQFLEQILISDNDTVEIGTTELDIIDASLNILLKGEPTVVKAFYYPDSITAITPAELENLRNVGDVNDGGIRLINIATSIDGDVRNFELMKEFDEVTYNAKLLQVSSENYITGYFVLANPISGKRSYLIPSQPLDCIKLYLVRKEHVLNGKISVKHEYPFIDSTSPKITKEDDEGNTVMLKDAYACMSFSIFFDDLSKEERSKIAVFARFTKNTSEKVFLVSSAVDNMWNPPVGVTPGATPRTMTQEDFDAYKSAAKIEFNYENPVTHEVYPIETNITNVHPLGMIENYKPNFNFDDEDLGDFELILKYFDEGNDSQTYTSKYVVLKSFVTDSGYTVEIYAYYKTSNAVYQNMYFGECGITETLE